MGSRRGRSKGAELKGRIKGVEGCRVTLPHWRGWWGWGSSGVMLLYRPLYLLGLSLANTFVCTHRYGGMHM